MDAPHGYERKQAHRRGRRRVSRRTDGKGFWQMKREGPFRIGFPRLSDAAPIIVALERGYFAEEGIEVELSVEPSWSNVSDKLSYGLLDGALMLPPLALALYLGLSGSGGPERVIVPMALSLNGITVTLSEDYIRAITGNDPAALAGL